MASGQQNGSRWYPTRQQLADPIVTERSFRQTLVQQYALEDRVRQLEEKMAAPAKTGSSSAFPPGSGPADSVLLGLPVSPIDTSSLADGATLKFVKAQGVFKFE